jgi:glycerate kinase
MRVLVCPTAFKGSIGAAGAASALARGVRRAVPDARVDEMPLSDGGPGLLDALNAVGPGAPVERVTVTGPLGGLVQARILWMEGGALPELTPASPPDSAAGGDGPDALDASARGAADGTREVAVLESADACGIHLVSEGERDALRAHTRGVGETIQAAVVRGAREVVVGLGGSATTDGGTGMARAFGYRFLDEDGEELPPGGGPLRRLARIVPGRRPRAPVTALADVDTPMNGAAGAARTFGPQKGADAHELEMLVEGLERLSARLGEDLDAADVGDRRGSGAAGGLGGGLAAFLGAELVAGSDWVLEAVRFRAALGNADLLVTGEGTYDATSAEGKVTGRVAKLAREADVPVLLVCGDVSGELPDGVRSAHGEGRHLDVGDLADLAARGVERHAAP